MDQNPQNALDSEHRGIQDLRMNLVMHTDRLTLTPSQESDLDITIEMFTDPEVLRYAGGAMSEEKIRSGMSNWTRRGGEGECIGIWCATVTDTDEKLGTGALLPMPIDEKDTDYDLLVPGQMPDGDIEIGYFLKRSAWGNGYATEICRRLVRFAFEESPLVEVVATFEPGNEASRKVLEKSGFADHGMRWCYGEDSPDYRIAKADWLAAGER